MEKILYQNRYLHKNIFSQVFLLSGINGEKIALKSKL